MNSYSWPYSSLIKIVSKYVALRANKYRPKFFILEWVFLKIMY